MHSATFGPTEDGGRRRCERRQFLKTGIALGGSMLVTSRPASAQAQGGYPNRPIRIVIPVPPGAGPDVDIRTIALKLTNILGQPVIIENRPGAATRIATEIGVRAPADGYTFLMVSPSLVLNPLTRRKLAYDYQRDLIPVALLSTTGYALAVSGTTNIRSLDQFVQHARAERGQTTFATLGAGTASHLTAAWLCDVVGIEGKFVHYQTSPPYGDVSTAQVSAVFESVYPLAGFIKTGKLRLLATSGAMRNRLYPEMPTFADAGYPDFTPHVWSGIAAPADTPKAITDRFSAALSEAVRDPEYLRISEESSRNVVGSTPHEFKTFLERERAQWAPVVKKLDIQLD